ncbi:anhydro-N-acetylmuramic acid kinase [Isoptericola chiayiensis]|uniref:Anhydro-N-acetylmuramic acid kinase n=1 Tax=Isoptericola chiayiensis TaxID=579446 RepID=A0ABP8YQH2_9MICO|nr:anhydro-N-acetylmuramic acid kinase [Isoptericola chiayiensis]NOW01829.1 anhydro-N-acetylmuramic acid kinase [Isoptericola chiayiensis]
MIVAGLMSGTSADGLDVALVDLALDGSALDLRLLARREVAFPDALADDILRLLEPRDVPLSLVSSVDARLGRLCAEAVAETVADSGAECELVVMHGQTVRHDVTDGVVTATWQLGQPAWVAERTGCPVLSDVRSRDVAAGGQGAPLASILDHLLLAGGDEPTAALNLGGIANITVVAPGEDTIAFDTGPANALIDIAARRITGQPRGFDRDGKLAARGEVVPELLTDLMAEPYYALRAPKSTGKELFHGDYLDRFLSQRPEATGPDVVATLTELTARTVADACVAHGVRSVVASGGGTRNPVLLAALRRALGDVPLTTTDDAVGLPEGAKEASLMALIGWLTWHGLPATLPSVTGAGHGTVAGRLSPGAGPLRLPEPLPTLPETLRVH